jgi:hypothetical protein
MFVLTFLDFPCFENLESLIKELYLYKKYSNTKQL